jgi:CRP/FNR family transcriptional regulator, cyclic AMP receptor protein
MNTEQLKHITVLRTMDSDSLARLAAALEELEFADGQTIFAEGDPGDSMYFILEGCIRIEKRAQATGAVHKTLAVIEAGDYFGEMALIEQKPRSATAVAAGGAKILRLSKAAFDQIQKNNSVAGMNVLFAMIRTSSERIRRLSTQVVVYDEVGKAIGESGDLQALLNVILEQLLTATQADWALLLLRSQFSENLELRGQAKLDLTPAQREAVSAGRGFLGPVLQNPQAQLVANFDEHESFKSCSRLGFETASLLLSPISMEGQPLGLIVLGGNERGQFDLNSLNLVRGVARQAAQAILNARHREEEQARSRHSRQFVRF